MSKSLKILFITLILFLFILPNFVHAIDINMNLSNTATTNSISNENIENFTNRY